VDKKDTRKGKGEDGGEEEVDGGEGEGEALAGVFCCHDFDALLVFSEHGMVYMLQALDVPMAKKMSVQGSLLTDFLPELGDKHRITAIVTVPQKALKDQTDEFVVLVSAQGMAKKVSIHRFRGLRPGKGIPAMRLAPKDELRWAHRASAHCALVLASADGNVLRFSLGPDWPLSSPKGPGQKSMKMRGDDYIVSCGISQLTDKEIVSVAEVEAKRREKKEARLAAGSVPPAGEAEGNEEAGEEAPNAQDADAAPVARAAATPASARRKSVAMIDDDDSDNPAEAAAVAAPPAAGPAEGKAERGDGEDSDNDGEAAQGVKDSDSEKDDDDEADSDGERPAAAPRAADADGGEGSAAAGAEGSEQNPAKDMKLKDPGQCILLVSESGMGLRMPLACRRIGLRRRGGAGMRCMKLAGGKNEDIIASACIVSGKSETELPTRGRKAFVIWFEEHKAALSRETGAAPADEAGANTQASQPAEAGGSQEATNWFAWVSEKFKGLPQAEQEDYLRKEEEEKLQIQEERRKTVREEVLFGSKRGLIVRVAVGCIPVFERACKGKVLCRLQGGDSVCTAALLSSIDNVAEEGTAESTSTAPRAPKPALPARRPVKRLARGKESGASSGALTTAAGAGLLHSPLRPSGASPAGREQPDDARCSRRLRGKTRQSLALCPWLARRGRLSLLASSPKSRAASAARYAAQQSARLSIVKPQLRLINKTRKSVVVRSLDLSEWAAKAAAAAAASLTPGSNNMDVGR